MKETIRVYKSIYNNFIEWLERSGIPAENAAGHVEEFLLSKPLGEMTRRVYASAINYFLLGKQSLSPITPIPTNWGPADWRKWRNRALMILVAETPLSLRRISHLNRGDFGGDYIQSGEKFFLSKLAQEAMINYLSLCPFSDCPDAPLFVSATGGRMSVSTLRTAIFSALEEQGISGVGIHSLRHSFSPPSTDKLTLDEFNRLLDADELSLTTRVAIALLANGLPLEKLVRIEKGEFRVGEEIWIDGKKIEYGEKQVREWLSSPHTKSLFGDGVTKQMVSRLVSDAVFLVTGKRVPPRLLHRQYRQESIKKRPRPRPIDKLAQKIERQGVSITADELAYYFSVLSPREKFVLQSRYEEGRTLHEVGKMLGVSRQMVHMIERRAINKIVGAARQP